jgi:hypothetical protein
MKLEKFSAYKLENSKLNNIRGGYKIAGSGSYYGSDYTYSGDISSCEGTGTTSFSIWGATASNTKTYKYDCDWSLTVTLDGRTKSGGSNGMIMRSDGETTTSFINLEECSFA